MEASNSRECGTKRHPPTARVALNRRRSRRKRDRAPRLMARKPSSAGSEAEQPKAGHPLRPALEGENE